jgi:carboxyl-terminal processing protease
VTSRAVWSRVALMWGVAGTFMAGFWFGGYREQARQPWARERLLSTALDSVRVNFLDSLPEAELMRRAVSGMLRELNDPYSALLERDGVSAYRGTLRGESQGLGLLLRLRGSAVVVRRVTAGSPAEAAGLRAGDLVLAVDGRPAGQAWTTPRPTGGVADSAGVVADSIRLQVLRLAAGDTAELTVVRAPWRMPAVTEALLAADGVGYARLATASSGSAEELERAVDSLLERGARSLVLDLRGNMGGLYDEGVRAASLFLSRGQVVASLERRGERGHEAQTVRRSRWPELPLVVLVDQYTASSAELIAAALRDHGRALLVGEHTYGKGMVQRVVTINPELSLRLTTARWLPPSGVPIERREEKNGRVFGGLTPDVLITPASRLDPSAVPASLSPVQARTLSDAVDAVVVRAMRDGWSGAPSPLLERRVRAMLDEALPTADLEPARRTALLGDGTRVGVRRLLEMTRGDAALWPYAAYDDPGFRAALDVVAPGLSTAALVDSARPRVAMRDAELGDTVALARLSLWTERRFVGRRLDGVARLTASTSRPPARIDGRLRSGVRDTIVALHFAAGPFESAHDAGEAVVLADASGAATTLGATVVARLPFRAPVAPSPHTFRQADWRHGWAYLVVLSPEAALAHPGGFVGWRIVAAPPKPARSARVAARPAPAGPAEAESRATP